MKAVCTYALSAPMNNCSMPEHTHIRMADCLRHQHRQWSISLGMQSKRSFCPSALAWAVLHNYFSMSGDRMQDAGHRTWMQLPQTAAEATGCHQLCFGSAESLRKGRANKKLNLSTNLSKYLPGLHLFPSLGNSTPSPRLPSISIDAIEAGSSLLLFCPFLRCQQRV